MMDIKTLKAYIEEQRRFHDELTRSYEMLRTKIVTQIGGTLALLAFLYAGALDTTKTTLERLFIPPELYGKIFYYLGLFFILYSLGKVIHGARPNGVWTVAYQSQDNKPVESMAHKDYLIKLKNDYDKARADNAVQYSKKYEAYKDAFYPLLAGAIIMIVLRYFQ